MHYGRAPRIDHRMQSPADEAKRAKTSFAVVPALVFDHLRAGPLEFIPHQGERQAALADVGVVLRQVECDFARLYCIHIKYATQWLPRVPLPRESNVLGRGVVDRVIECSGAQKAGLIASLARPGGNVTGAINQLEELTAKQLELLKALVPRAKRVIVLSSGKSMVEDETREGARAAAKVLGLTLVDAWADTPEKFAGVPARCGRERCDALLVLLDPQLVNLRSELVTFAAKLRIPAVYPNLEYADDGGLLAYSIDANEIFRRVAAYVDKILKGAKPGDLPVELPTKFELVINLKAARAQGIAIPQPLLLRANRVIE